MPRIKQNNDVYMRNDFIAAVHTGQGIAGVLQKKELAEASGIPYSTLRKRLEKPEDLSIDELRKLIYAIPLDPESILRFLGFSTKRINEMKRGAKE